MLLPFAFAVLAAVFWAITNHIDKYMISKAVKNADHRALVVVSSLVAGLVMAIIYAFICGFNFTLDWQSILILFGNSALYALTLVFWFKAISRDDPTIVVIMFQLIPVFSLIISPLFLKEDAIRPLQLVGGAITTLAAISVTYESSKKKFSKKKLVTLGLMTCTSLGYALWFIIERYVNQNHDFNETTFWSNATLFLVGVLILIFIKSYRKSFKKMLKTNGAKIISINLINELFNSFGGIFSTLASTMASVAIVSFISQGVQPFAVMILGIIITKLFPKLGKETIHKKEVLKRTITIIICAIGLALIQFG